GELRVEALPPTGVNEAAGSGAPTAVAAPAAQAPEATGERVATTSEHGERSGLASNAADPLRQTWTKRVSAGDYAAVVAEAQAGGLASPSAPRPLADLTALSDAARYLGLCDIARQTLLAERERFAGSPDAKGAAFLLGRISQDAGDTPSAIAWFTTYL